jgi:hypothetical protein
LSVIKEKQNQRNLSEDDKLLNTLNDLILKERESKLNNDIMVLQENIGQQVYVLTKMGRYKETLEKYEIQAGFFVLSLNYEEYANCLLSQAELLIDYMGMPKEAKSLLEEAISVAVKSNFSHIVREAEIMIKK